MGHKCFYCKGSLERGKTSFTVTRKGYHLIIDDVPAWVCRQCGEALLDEEVVDLIQEMVREMDARMERLEAVA